MKITKSKLKQIIKEEMVAVLKEANVSPEEYIKKMRSRRSGDDGSYESGELTKPQTPEDAAAEKKRAADWTKSPQGQAFAQELEKLVKLSSAARPGSNWYPIISNLLTKAMAGSTRYGAWNPTMGWKKIPQPRILKQIVRYITPRAERRKQRALGFE